MIQMITWKWVSPSQRGYYVSHELFGSSNIPITSSNRSDPQNLSWHPFETQHSLIPKIAQRITRQLVSLSQVWFNVWHGRSESSNVETTYSAYFHIFPSNRTHHNIRFIPSTHWLQQWPWQSLDNLNLRPNVDSTFGTDDLSRLAYLEDQQIISCVFES